MSVTDNLALAAINSCVDIYSDYEQSEVNKFAPKSVREAWNVGKMIMENEMNETRNKVKSLKL
jgi:hypothetical protein